MPIHDAYARLTPYELLLPTEAFAEERFPLVREEARERGVDLSDPEPFPLLAQVGRVLKEIRPEDEETRLLAQHGTLLFHAFHFWQEGRPLFLLEEGALRFLTRNGPEEGQWSPALPGPAGYVQLPQHLMWAPGGEGAPPESLDGFFWSAPDGESVSLLVVMGLRKDRPGMAVVPLPTLPLAAAAPWASMQVREEGDDFQSSLPGAELEGLLAVEAGAEAVKLAMRVFWYLDAFPGSVKGGRRGEAEGQAPRPSGLDYRRIVLAEL